MKVKIIIQNDGTTFNVQGIYSRKWLAITIAQFMAASTVFADEVKEAVELYNDPETLKEAQSRLKTVKNKDGAIWN